MGKVIGGGLPAAAYGGSRELMERIAPAGDVYQAGTLSGTRSPSPPAWPTLRAARRAPPTRAWPPRPSALAEGLREAAGDRPGPGRVRAGPAHGLLLRRAGARLRRRQRCDLEAYARLVPRRCWRAASTRRRRSSRPGSRRWPTTPSTSSARSRPRPPAFARGRADRAGGRSHGRAVLRDEGGLLADALRRRAPAAGRRAAAPRVAAGPRARGREADVRASSSRRSARATCCTTARPRLLAATEPDLALLAGDRLYALGLARLADAGRPRGGRRAGRRDRAAAPRRTPRSDRELAEAVWQAGVAAVGWGTTRRAARPPRARRARAIRGARRGALARGIALRLRRGP